MVISNHTYEVTSDPAEPPVVVVLAPTVVSEGLIWMLSSEQPRAYAAA